MGTLYSFFYRPQGSGLCITPLKYLQKSFSPSHTSSPDPEQFSAISVNKQEASSGWDFLLRVFDKAL